MPRLACLAAACLLALLVAPVRADAATSGERSRACGNIGFTPASEDGVFRIRARNVGCRTARRVARAARFHPVGPGRHSYTARGFSCRGRFEERTLPQVRWRCTRREAVVIFVRS